MVSTVSVVCLIVEVVGLEVGEEGEVVLVAVGEGTGSILREALEGFGAFEFTLITFSESLSS